MASEDRFAETFLVHLWFTDMVCEKLDFQPAANQKCERTSRKADMKFYVDEFFNVLPRSPSHYFRASSSKLYLHPLFQSFADVYNLHLTKSKESNRRSPGRQVLKKKTFPTC